MLNFAPSKQTKVSLDKQQIRRQIKRQRKELTKAEQSSVSRAIARHAKKYRQLFNCRMVLAYSAFAGEADPGKLIEALATTTDIYLPRITNYRTRVMQFLPRSASPQVNRIGIEEPPLQGSRVHANQFDAVLVPLVAFDRQGARLGMGGGFYDRAFAFRLNNRSAKRPLLIGLAHHFQEQNQLIPDTWDVPLDAIITDRELIIT